ncbi:MAG: tRNA pseudouridine(55) synthase TruB [Chitinophagaceae bacterium]
MKKKIEDLNFVEGERILLDKPYGNTSFGLVAQLKKWTKAKIGHAGTLDPLASGLVICCTGKKTKTLTELIGLDKEYTGTITIGACTPTYDLESEPYQHQPYHHIQTENIEEAQKKLSGNIMQTPPIHSAIKQDGKPVYELARQGIEVRMKERPVTIHQFVITEIKLPDIHFRIQCSSGTYIRTIAHDFGQLLGVGAYLSSLRRTKIGEHAIEDAYTLDELANHFGTRMNLKCIEPKQSTS